MKQKNEVSERVAEIYYRFFFAIEADHRTYLKQFCDEHGFNYRKFIELKKKYYNGIEGITRYTIIPLDAILILVDELQLNMNWVLTGEGNIYNNNVKYKLK